MSTTIQHRNFGLDIIRTFAILFVVLFHINLTLTISNLIDYRFYIPNGVELFFVLSGYLIGTILIDTVNNRGASDRHLFEFWMMRWFRTLPNYYLFMFIVFGLFNHFHFKWHNFFFLQNFYKTQNVIHFETWSLAVEEWFYILFPICLFSFIHITTNLKRSLLSSILLFVIGGLLIRYYYIAYHFKIDFNHLKTESRKLFEIKTLVVNRMDSICIGVLGAYFNYYYTDFWKSKKWIFFCIGIPIFLYCTVVETNLIDYQIPTVNKLYWASFTIIFSISILMLFPLIQSIDTKNRFVKFFFTFTSKISYTMYLLHMVLLKFFALICVMIRLSPTFINLLLAVTVYFIFLYLLSYLNYRYFEKKFLTYRIAFINKFFIKRMGDADLARSKSTSRINT